jgi:hypothetical protein
MFLQIGILGGGVTFALTLWRTLGQGGMEPLPAILRAVIAGTVVCVAVLIIGGILDKLGDADTPER